MNERDYLAERFEENRTHLRAVAYRMLGSVGEVDDAVQEAWLRLSRADTTGIDNLGGWLTTVVARVCLDMLRSRKSRREEPLAPDAPEPVATGTSGSSPEHDALLADSVGLALLVVLDTADAGGTARLRAARHVRRAVRGDRTDRRPFRRRRRGSSPAARDAACAAAPRRPTPIWFGSARSSRPFSRHCAAATSKACSPSSIPDLVVRADMAAPAGAPSEIRGAAVWAKGAVAFGHLAQLTRPALVNGAIGVVVAPRGRLVRALQFTIANGKIAEIEVIGNPARLGELDVSIAD